MADPLYLWQAYPVFYFDFNRDGYQDLIPLLYQSGYLTIVDYDEHKERYTLGFPNDEVKYGFLESL